jgi:membrane fusion protein (multidrug efflux system)
MTTTASVDAKSRDAVASQPEAQEASAAPAKKGRARAIALAVLAAGALGIVGYYVMHSGLEDTDDAQLDADVVSVPARIGGQVQKVLFEENQRVKTGDVLVELDSAQPKARLDEAEAQLAADKAAADAADNEVSIIGANATGQRGAAVATLRGSSVAASATEDQNAQADAQVKQASVAREQAKTDLERVKQLFEQRAVPRQQLDDAQSKFDAAEAALTQAKAQQSFVRAGVAQAQSRVAEADARVKQSGSVDAQIAQAKARAAAAHAKVATSQAARDLAALDLSYTKIVAPRDGLASKKSVVVGQMVSMGQPVVQIVPVDDLWVTANFKETQLNKMRAGQSAEVDVDAYSGLKLHGTVQSFSGATGARFSLLPPENATGNFTKVVQRVPVRIHIDALPQDRPLRPGMSVEVTVDTRK